MRPEELDDRLLHARTALEEVCARGDLARARELYATDFVDHVNALEFRGQAGIANSVAIYRALFPDLQIEVLDQVSANDRVVSRWELPRHPSRPAGHAARHHDQPLRGNKIAEDWTVSDNLECFVARPAAWPSACGALRHAAAAGLSLPT